MFFKSLTQLSSEALDGRTSLSVEGGTARHTLLHRNVQVGVRKDLRPTTNMEQQKTGKRCRIWENISRNRENQEKHGKCGDELQNGD